MQKGVKKKALDSIIKLQKSLSDSEWFNDRRMIHLQLKLTYKKT